MNTLTWDARTQMPAQGAVTRGHQLATLSRIAQEKFTNPAMEQLLERAAKDVQRDDPDSYRVR
ncbi:MAG: carboxypeptidase M32, partial [Caldilineaceae bacterium]|nr:carboxypeptidase M32 [Caldilineaceae bacterium]